MIHDPSSLGLVLAAALAAGFVDAIVGGGGLIQLPALFSAYPGTVPRELLGTNKLGSIMGTSGAVLRYARFVRIPWRRILPAAAAACLAAAAGAQVASVVPAAAFRPLVPVMLLAVLAYVLWHKDLGTRHAPVEAARGRRRLLETSGIAVIGFYDGFFGPGTGSFLMLYIIRVWGFDFLNAAAGARVINVATNFGALLLFGLHGAVHLGLGVALGLFNASGSMLGAQAARRHGARFVRTAYIVVVTALIAKTAHDAIHQAL